MSVRTRLERLEQLTRAGDAEAMRARLRKMMRHPGAWDLITALADREAAGEVITDDDPVVRELLNSRS